MMNSERSDGAVITELNENTFGTFIRQAECPVLVDFWADWCPPCQQLLPLLEQAAQALEGQVRVTKVNTQQAPAVGFQYAIRSIPTLMLFDRGQEVARRAGVMTPQQIQRWILDAIRASEFDRGAEFD